MTPFLFMIQSVLVLCDIKLLVKGASININLCKEENQWCLINTLSSVNLCLNACVKMWVLWNSEFSKSKVMIRIWNSLFEQGNLRTCKSSCLLFYLWSDKNDRPVCHGKYCLYKVLNFSRQVHVEEKCSFVMKSAFPTMIFSS